MEALQTLRREPHTLLIAPTGSGKSLVFQTFLQGFGSRIPRTLLVSPLNALSRQHLRGLQHLGLSASIGTPPKDRGVWISSPERLACFGESRLRAWGPEFLIVDEAHCIWEWGERFRPAFREIPEWVRTYEIPKSFWCSATVPLQARRDLSQRLQGRLAILGGFRLPETLNLQRHWMPWSQRMDFLRAVLEARKSQSGMIFVNTRSASERLQFFLKSWGFSSLFYHAGMALEERLLWEAELERRKTSGQPVWVVATSAFGMGMDYPFLQTCVLFEPGFSLLSIAQALGRVARSGSRGTAICLWHPDDFLRNEWASSSSHRAAVRHSEVAHWYQTEEDPRAELERYFN